MSLEYIRKFYDVPATEGERVIVFSGQRGAIIGAVDSYLLIRLDGEKRVKSFHPDWNIDYFSNCPWLKNDETNQPLDADTE